MPDFTNIDYLKNGNEKQIAAYKTLTQNQVLSHLAAFDAVLVGTIPIRIDIENSDLDIACYWKDKNEFIHALQFHFGHKNKFSMTETMIENRQTIVANFMLDSFEIEVFGQNIPVKNQNGFRHMVIEHEILQAKGESFRREIVKLKQHGYKTEPAFGLLLGFGENPYLELLDYKVISDSL